MAVETLAPDGRMAKDPNCGVVVPTATALSAQRAGRTSFFSSQGCRQTFQAPEQELRRLRRRVGIALDGVLALLVVVFAPGLLPAGTEERGIYFEVSAVVIAFVLMGRTTEELIRQRSSGAVRRLALLLWTLAGRFLDPRR